MQIWAKRFSGFAFGWLGDSEMSDSLGRLLFFVVTRVNDMDAISRH